MGFQVGDGIAPIGDLPPRVDDEAWLTVADPEPAVIMHQHHQTRLGEHPRKPVPNRVRGSQQSRAHRDRRSRSRPVGNKQPPAQRHIPLDAELGIKLLHDDFSSKCRLIP